MKWLKRLLLLSFLLPQLAFAAFTVPLTATTTSGTIFAYPSSVNGILPALQSPFFFATSSSATSTFNGPVQIGAQMQFPSLVVGSSTPSSGFLNNDLIEAIGNRNDFTGEELFNNANGTCAASELDLNGNAASLASDYFAVGHTSTGYTGTGCPSGLTTTGFNANSSYLFDPNGYMTFWLSSTTQASFIWGTGGEAAANEKMRLSNGGNLGIGTTSPGTLLSLGNTGASTINFSAVATSSIGSGLKILGGGLQLATVKSCSSTQALVTDASGNVGCGTISGSGGGISDPFTHTSVFGQTTSATSTLLAFTGTPASLAASSTAFFDQIKVGTTTGGKLSTSTFQGLSVANFAQTGTATSTFANGLSITNGCYLLPSGVCVGPGGATGGGSSMGVNWATTAALPSNNYVNGVAGLGATIAEIGNGALSVDGNSPVVGDRILVKNETSTHNGIYSVTAAGSAIATFLLTRVQDYDQPIEVTQGMTTYVLTGTANTDTTWAVSFTAPLSFGSTGLTYTVSAGAGSFTGTYPITVTGTTISTAFGTTTNWGIGNNGFVVTGASGIPFTTASSTLNLPNSALANSTISSIALGGTLNSLSNDGATLSGSSYNGSSAISNWAINLNHSNIWTAVQSIGLSTATSTHSDGIEANGIGSPWFSATSTTATSMFNLLNVVTTLTIPNQVGAFSFTGLGNIGIETGGISNASSSLNFYDGTAVRSIYDVTPKVGIFASSTLVYDGGGTTGTTFGAAGTTTLEAGNFLYPFTVIGIHCFTPIGSLWVGFGTGAATTTELKCGNPVTFTPVSANNSWTAAQNFYIELGTSANSPTNITVTYDMVPTKN